MSTLGPRALVGRAEDHSGPLLKRTLKLPRYKQTHNVRAVVDQRRADIRARLGYRRDRMRVQKGRGAKDHRTRPLGADRILRCGGVNIETTGIDGRNSTRRSISGACASLAASR